MKVKGAGVKSVLILDNIGLLLVCADIIGYVPGCVPNYTNNRQAAVFDVPIRGDFRCGVGKMTNKITVSSL